MTQNVDMSGKVCVVTGANSGLGKQTALELAGMGARVVMICRNAERGAAAQQEIIQQSGSDKVDLLLADLSLQREVRQVAAAFRAQYDRLDVLVNNAGALFTEYGETDEGIERTFALNHIGYFLLTTLLLDVLKASAPARVVNVSSAVHHLNKRINYDNPNLKGEYKSMKVYGHSKLANILFTRSLAQRLSGSGVTANSLHPGSVATNFGNNFGTDVGFFSRIIMKIASNFIIPLEEGVRTSVYLASSPEVEGVTGKYFVKCKEKKPSRVARDDTAAEKLWQLSEELTAER